MRAYCSTMDRKSSKHLNSISAHPGHQESLGMYFPSQGRVLTEKGDLYRNYSGVGPAVRPSGIHQEVVPARVCQSWASFPVGDQLDREPCVGGSEIDQSQPQRSIRSVLGSAASLDAIKHPQGIWEIHHSLPGQRGKNWLTSHTHSFWWCVLRNSKWITQMVSIFLELRIVSH